MTPLEERLDQALRERDHARDLACRLMEELADYRGGLPPEHFDGNGITVADGPGGE